MEVLNAIYMAPDMKALYVCMYVCMYVWMDGWMDGCIFSVIT